MYSCAHRGTHPGSFLSLSKHGSMLVCHCHRETQLRGGGYQITSVLHLFLVPVTPKIMLPPRNSARVDPDDAIRATDDDAAASRL